MYKGSLRITSFILKVFFLSKKESVLKIPSYFTSLHHPSITITTIKNKLSVSYVLNTYYLI